MPRDPRAVRLVGPRWVRLLEARAGDRQAVVVFCFDKGYWHQEGIGGEPRPEGQRSDISTYRLVLVPGADGAMVWKVDYVAITSVPVSEPELMITEQEAEAHKQECADWATHTPADIPRYARPEPRDH